MRHLTVVVLVAIVSCRSHPTPSATPALPSLRAISEAYNRAPASRNADSVVAFFDSSVVSMSPQGRGPVRGIELNRAAWERFFRGGNPTHTMTSDTVVVSASGDLGYTFGQWTVGVDTPTGRAEAAGAYVAVWRLRKGGWRIVVISAYPSR